MDRLRRIFKGNALSDQDYEPVDSDEPTSSAHQTKAELPFSWIDYGIFLLLGVSMLWAWNMFLAAAPYFQFRFEASPWARDNFQSSIIVTSNLISLPSILILTRAQKNASYPRRTQIALAINLVANLLLAGAALKFPPNVEAYFGFLLLMVALSAFATALQQNALFSMAAGFEREEYVQAIMAGQGVAGVTPCIVQIVSILSLSQKEAESGKPTDLKKSAFVYFLTAVGITLLTILAFTYLMRRHHRLLVTRYPGSTHGEEDDDGNNPKNQQISLLLLLRKLKYYAGSLFLCFGISMVFPVFAQKIYSVLPENEAPRLFQKATFIPLALLLWNLGDVLGKASLLIPGLRLTRAPKVAAVAAVARLAFVPLFFLCNIRGHGAVIQSDFFYLVVVQFLFGLTNGWLGSACMMAAPHWVDDEEKAAAGGFMGFILISGLTAGGLLSFLVS